MNLLRSLIFVTLVSVGIAEVKNLDCIPTGYDGICILEKVEYEWNGTTTHVVPDNLRRHVRIRNLGQRSGIPHVDSGLYLMLGRPSVLELTNVEIETLEIPRTLRHGNFADNSIRKCWVSENETAKSTLVYLDLSGNWLRQMPTGIEILVNLEVLDLGSNSIEEIAPNTLTKLTKLRYVNLNYNNLRRLSTDQFPLSVNHLELYMNYLNQLNYTQLHFPAMEILNLERNQLKQLDAVALILAMPRLKTVRIGGNSFDEENLYDAVRFFRMYNISYRNDADVESCYYYENIVEGVCLPETNRAPMGIGQAIVFTVMVLAVGVVFVLVTRWVLKEMNKC